MSRFVPVMTIAQKRLAFAFLAGTMEAEPLTVPVITDYYALTGIKTSSGALSRVLGIARNNELIARTKLPQENRQGPPTYRYETTEQGLAIFGIAYLHGLTEAFSLDVSGFQHEAQSDLGQFALVCATGLTKTQAAQ